MIVNKTLLINDKYPASAYNPNCLCVGQISSVVVWMWWAFSSPQNLIILRACQNADSLKYSTSLWCLKCSGRDSMFISSVFLCCTLHWNVAFGEASNYSVCRWPHPALWLAVSQQPSNRRVGCQGWMTHRSACNSITIRTQPTCTL